MRVFMFALAMFVAVPCFGDEAYLEVGTYLEAKRWHNSPQGWEVVDSLYSTGQLSFTKFSYVADLFSNLVYIGGNIKTYVLKEKDAWTFAPIYLDYTAVAGIRIDSFEIGMTHLCAHPQNLLEGAASPLERMNVANTEIHVKFSMKLPGHF